MRCRFTKSFAISLHFVLMQISAMPTCIDANLEGKFWARPRGVVTPMVQEMCSGPRYAAILLYLTSRKPTHADIGLISLFFSLSCSPTGGVSRKRRNCEDCNEISVRTDLQNRLQPHWTSRTGSMITISAMQLVRMQIWKASFGLEQEVCS